jgi:hypothetical protein
VLVLVVAAAVVVAQATALADLSGVMAALVLWAS